MPTSPWDTVFVGTNRVDGEPGVGTPVPFVVDGPGMRGIPPGNGRVVVDSRPGAVPYSSQWLLRTGYWQDELYWQDTGVWVD